MTFDPDAVRASFPGLQQQVHGRPLVYLDNAATTQRPVAVLDALHHAHAYLGANVHRGVHELSRRATTAYEGARDTVATFLGGVPREEVVFTRGTTEALNLLAHGLGQRLGPGDEVLLTEMEHHANLVPWQLACARSGAVLKHIPVTDDGSLDLAAMPDLLSERTKVLGLVHASNTLGTINPVADLAARAKELGAIVVIDGAQWVAHGPTHPRALGADAYVFSGHKLYGPTGIGVLWGTTELLESLPVWQGGGDMIRTVSLHESTFADLPTRLEAGTPPIAQAIGLGAAIDWVTGVGWEPIHSHEAALMDRLDAVLADIPGVRRVGTSTPRVSLASFVFDTVHAHDVGTIADHHGVAVRTGHHCTEPLMDRFDVPATVRASLAIYNQAEDLDRLDEALRAVARTFGL